MVSRSQRSGFNNKLDVSAGWAQLKFSLFKQCTSTFQSTSLSFLHLLFTPHHLKSFLPKLHTLSRVVFFSVCLGGMGEGCPRHLLQQRGSNVRTPRGCWRRTTDRGASGKTLSSLTASNQGEQPLLAMIQVHVYTHTQQLNLQEHMMHLFFKNESLSRACGCFVGTVQTGSVLELTQWNT